MSTVRLFGSSPVSILVLAALSVAAGLGIHYAATGVFAVLALVALVVAVRSRYAFVFIPAWAGVYLAIAPRLIVKFSGGGAGILPVAGITTLILAAGATLGGGGSSSAVLHHLLLKTRPLFAFTTAWAFFPILGLIVGYPARTLAASAVPLTALAFLMLGALGRSSDARFWRVLYWAIFGAVASGAVAGLLQAGALGSGLSALASPLRLWDGQMMSQYGTPMLYARQIGLYVNPNSFALLGAVGMLYGLYADELTSIRRVGVSLPSLVILVLSASRAVIMATLIAAALDLVISLARGSGRLSLGRFATIVGVAGAALAGATYISERIVSFVERMSSGVGAITSDAAIDSSVWGRFVLWRGGLDHLRAHPLGTFGPPQLSLGTSIDNEYLYMLIQGGVVLLALYLGALFGLYRVVPDGENRRFSRSAIIMVLVSAISQTALTSEPAMIAVWLATGATVAGSIGLCNGEA